MYLNNRKINHSRSRVENNFDLRFRLVKLKYHSVYMAIGNGELVKECSPTNLNMGTAIMK